MKATILSILFALFFVGGALLLSNNPSSNLVLPDGNNVSIVEGKQIIEIDAKGGYSPRQSIAKADIPTIVRVETSGTFDCSSTLRIPTIGYQKNLPSSGTTDIEIPPQKPGTTIQGLCAMGMFNFQIQFN